MVPRMTPQPPPEYIAFVARHLPQLRRDAVRLAGDEPGADGLYSQALTDVAVRWAWFALLRTRLHQPDAAAAYLQETLVRRSTRTLPEQDRPVQIEVWCSDDPRAALDPPPGRARTPPPPDVTGTPPVPARSSTALRLLPIVVRELGVEVGPVAEAGVAWWHAYETHRRARLIGIGTAACLVLAIMIRLVGG